MNSATSSEARYSLTTSTKKATSEGHRRNASADSGHFDMSAIVESSERDSQESTMTDLSQEAGATDRSPVRHKLSQLQGVRGSAYSNSSDSGVGGSISQESMELDDDERENTEEKGTECEMDEDDPLQPKGEDCPDFPESVVSQAIRGFYSLLVEVFSNQVSADKLASDLYSQFLIENTTLCGDVRVQSITNETKAQRVLDAVMSKLRTSPSKELFEQFIAVLESYPSCCDIVEQIRATYQQLQQSSEVSASGRFNAHIHHHAREELVCGNSTRTAVPLQHQGSLQSLVKEKQPDSPQNRTIESSDGNHQEQKRSAFSMLRQRSISIGAESDVSMTEEEIQEGLKKLQKESRRLARGIQKCMDRKQKDAGTMEEINHRLESMVEDLEKQLEESSKELERCNDENQALKGRVVMMRRQILQLNKEIIDLKRHPCTGTCEYKAKFERLEKQIKRLKEEKLDYTAKIENLTQQRDLLLNDSNCVFSD